MTLSSQQQVAFDASAESSKPKVEITGHPGVDWGEAGIPLRVYPTGCIVKCTSGQVTMDTTRNVEMPGDFLSFSGTSASLRYPPLSAPDIELMWGFDEQGEEVSEVGFKVNLVTGQITATKSFTGLIKVGDYSTSYQLIWYRPETQIFNLLGSSFPGIHVEYGVVCAYKDGGLAIHQVELPDIKQGTDKVELWRVVSKTVIDPEGEWEYPSNWTTTYAGKYPDNKTGPNKDSSAVKERVHEIGYITATGGTVWYDKFPKFMLQPYQAPTQQVKTTGNTGMQPVVELRTQDPNSLFPDNASAKSAAAFAIEQRKTIAVIR